MFPKYWPKNCYHELLNVIVNVVFLFFFCLMGSCGCSRSSAPALTEKHWYCRNADSAFFYFLVNIVQHAHFNLNLVWTFCPHNLVRVVECKWLPPFVLCQTPPPTPCDSMFFSCSHNVSPACASQGTCASHVCNICLQFAKHLRVMVVSCLSRQPESVCYISTFMHPWVLKCWPTNPSNHPPAPSKKRLFGERGEGHSSSTESEVAWVSQLRRGHDYDHLGFIPGEIQTERQSVTLGLLSSSW